MRREADYWLDLNVHDVLGLVEEPFMPPSEILKWRVRFYYQVGTLVEDYWKNRGKSWDKDVEAFAGRKKGISEAVAQTVAATDTPEQKVLKIYAFVAGLENQSCRPARKLKSK